MSRYNLDGSLAQRWLLSANGANQPTPVFNYTNDLEGRAQTISDGAQTPLAAAQYDAAGHATQVSLGSGAVNSYQFDPARGWMTQYQFAIGGHTDTGALGWYPNGRLNSLLGRQLADAPSS